MASKSDTTIVTSEALRDMAKSLETFASNYRRMADLMDEAEIKSLPARSMVTGVQGVLDTGTFCGYVLTAFLQHIGEEGMRKIAGSETEFRIRHRRTKAHREAFKAQAKPKRPDITEPTPETRAEGKALAKEARRKIDEAANRKRANP